MHLYNSLVRKKELFIPLNKNTVTLYVCGITPYDITHLGHAFTYLSFDILVRYLKYLGFKVIYTQNITDINDRDKDILERAKQQNIPWKKLAEVSTKKFLEDMRCLNWIMPTNYLKASESINSVIFFIKKLLANGFAYEVKGSVYLNIDKGNVLICECKIWGGQALYGKTIDQLLGYLTWRQNFGIMITFVKQKNFSKIKLYIY